MQNKSKQVMLPLLPGVVMIMMLFANHVIDSVTNVLKSAQITIALIQIDLPLGLLFWATTLNQ